MRLPLLVASITCAMSVMTHAHEPELTDADISRIDSEVRKTVDEYINAVTTGDLTEMEEFWGDFDDFIHAGDGRVFGSRDKWIAWMNDNQPDRYISWKNSNTHVAVLANDAASYTTDFEVLSVTDGEELRVTGSWTYVLRRANARWSVVHSNGKHNEFSYYD